jgi:uncharacterized membrane protein YfcA
VLHLVLSVPAGVLIGLSLGALGGGGSILTVPALVYLLGQGAHGATTASLVIVGLTSLAGALAHWRAGRAQVTKGLVFGVLGVAGSFVGARLSAGVSTDLLLSAFAGLVLVAAVAMALRLSGSSGSVKGVAGQATTPREGAGAGEVPGVRVPRVGRWQGFGGAQRRSGPLGEGRASAASAEAGAGEGEGATVIVLPRGRSCGQAEGPVAGGPVAGGPVAGGPQRAVPSRLANVARVVLAATVVGLLTGFFGVGGGFVVVPALVLSLRFDMPVAVGTSLLVIAVNTAAALLARLGTRADVDWSVVGVFVVAAVAGSVAGNRVASVVRPKRLGLAFTLLLVAVAVYTGARSLPHLI